MEETVNKQVMNVLYAPTARQLVSQVNELEIQKEDIVTLQKVNNEFFLIYYK